MRGMCSISKKKTRQVAWKLIDGFGNGYKNNKI